MALGSPQEVHIFTDPHVVRVSLTDRLQLPKGKESRGWCGGTAGHGTVTVVLMVASGRLARHARQGAKAAPPLEHSWASAAPARRENGLHGLLGMLALRGVEKGSAMLERWCGAI